MAIKSSKKPKTPSAKKGKTQPAPEAASVEQAGNAATTHIGEFQRAQQKIEEEIRVRAYEFFEERGCQEGYDREDWVRAEAEVLARYQRPKSA
jgi:Protein of unknown function (DUF2934)